MSSARERCLEQVLEQVHKQQDVRTHVKDALVGAARNRKHQIALEKEASRKRRVETEVRELRHPQWMWMHSGTN